MSSPCNFWDFTAMTEVFRFEVIEAMFKKGVLTPDVANNLVSWRHSGFHVHASSPFMPADAELLRTRLAYAFRPPVAIRRMDFDGATVTVRTHKKQLLRLSPADFLAKLTTHIPDRYHERAGGPTQWVGDEVVGARGARKPEHSQVCWILRLCCPGAREASGQQCRGIGKCL